MYWGDNYSKWVRPIRTIVAVPSTMGTVGVPLKVREIIRYCYEAHQVMHPEFFEFNSINEYKKILRGKVILQPQTEKRELYKKVKIAEAKGFF